MQRIYLSRILEKPRQLEVNGQERMVRALQMPHRFQRLKGSALETIEIDPAAIENLFLSQKKLGPITLDGITLLPLRWEKHEETEEYTLVLDEAFFFPTCNLRNSVLDRAGLKALQMAEGTREEAAREALITLMLAGEGHYERLIKLENQDEFEFVIDKLDRFYPFPSEIQDNTIREFVEIAILSTFNQFFLGPSSTSGKYHPADEVTLGGLLHHCKRVAQLALKFCDRLGIEGITRDVIIAAALLHDICKSVEINEAGEFKWGYHSVEDHSVIAELWLAKILEDNFPHWSRRQKAKIKRILQSVRYHQNIWVDNYDTALT